MKIYKKLNSYLSGKILISWIISYIIILLIPTVCNIYMYGYSLNAVKNRIYENDSHMLDATSIAFDKMLSELANIAVSVQNSKSTEILLTASDRSVVDINSMELAKELKNLKNYNENINDIFVYFPCSQICVSANYFDTAGSFFARNYENSGIEQNYWLQMLNKFSYFEYMPIKTGDGGFIDFFYSIPLRNEFNKASVVIRLNDEIFFNTLSNYTDAQSKSMYIADKNNCLIFSHNGTPAIDENYNSIPEGLSEMRDKSGKKYVSIAKTSDSNHWKYISVTPYSEIQKEISYIRIPIFISLILCLILSAVLIGYFAKQNYKPIQRILSVVKHSSEKQSDKTNEYEIINDIVNGYVSNTQKIKHLLSSEQASKRNGFLANLVKGNTGRYGDIYEEAAKTDISFISDYFAVMLFNITDTENMFSEEATPPDTAEKMKSVEFIITNVFEELLGRLNKGFVTEFDGKIVCIANISKDHLAQWNSDIHIIVDEATDFIEKHFNFSFIISMSRIHKGFHELPGALSEADRAMCYRSVTKSNELVIYEDVAGSPSNQYYSEEQERRLMNFIRLGNYELARETVYDIIGSAPGDSQPHIENLHLLIHQLSAVILRVLFEDGYEGEQIDYSEFTSCLDKLISHSYTTSYSDTLDRLIKNACQIEETRAAERKQQEIDIKANSDNAKNADELIDNIKEYISENIKNSDLNIASIGYHFNLTPYYMSNVFKKSENISLLDYIAKARVSLVKQYLIKSDMSLNSLAEATGFNNSRTLMRIFRKFEGITPGQYKELVKNQKNSD